MNPSVIDLMIRQISPQGEILDLPHQFCHHTIQRILEFPSLPEDDNQFS